MSKPFKLIGELINNSFLRARQAWTAKDPAAYQKLARLQEKLGADCLTVNIDGTQAIQVKMDQMVEFLPTLVPALQEATKLPLAFDNPSALFHRKALSLYDRSRGPAPVLNSLAASREHLDEMISLVKEFDTRVIVMASERFTSDGGAPCRNAQEVHETAARFAERLRSEAGRRNDDIIFDPGLAPVGADTYGLVNMGLDAIRLIRKDPSLAGVHISVGLTNFSFGVPKELKPLLEYAYLTLALEAGLDYVLANPEKDLRIVDPADPVLKVVREALEQGRPLDGETQEDAGFRQAEKIMELYR